MIEDAAKIRVKTERATLDAKVVARDAANDLALLKVEGADFSPVVLSPDKVAKLGQTVFTVGFPMPDLQGFAPKVLAHGHHGENRAAGGRGGWSLRTATITNNHHAAGPLA